MEKPLTVAPLTQEEQQRQYEVHESLEKPGIQDPIPGWQCQEVVVDDFSTSDSDVTTMSPMGTSRIDKTPTSRISST